MTYNDKFQIFNYFLKISSPVLEVIFLVKSQVIYIYIYIYIYNTCNIYITYNIYMICIYNIHIIYNIQYIHTIYTYNI